MEGEEYTKREFESFRITETSFEPTSPSRNDTHRGDKYERNEILVPYNLFTEWKMDADDNDSPMNHRGFVLETGTYFASPYILRSMITDSRSLESRQNHREKESKSDRRSIESISELKFNSINLRIFLWRTNVYLWFIFDIWWWFVKKFDSFTLDHESFSNLFTKEGGQRSPRFIRLEFEIHREESLDYSIKYRDVMIHIELTVIYRAVCRGNQYTAISTGRVSTDGRVPNFNQRTGTIFEETRFFSRQRLRKRFN